MVGETSLLATDFGESEALAAEFLRHIDRQIAGFPELFEVLGEEPVVAIIGSGATRDSLERVGGEVIRP